MNKENKVVLIMAGWSHLNKIWEVSFSKFTTRLKNCDRSISNTNKCMFSAVLEIPFFSWNPLCMQNKFTCCSDADLSTAKWIITESLLSAWLFVLTDLANTWIKLVCFCLCAPGEDDVPAAVLLTVHLAGGGVEVRTETKGGATAHIGHVAEKEGNSVSHTHT